MVSLNQIPILIGRKQQQTEAIFDEAQDNYSKLYYAENCDINSDLKGNYQNEKYPTQLSKF